MEKSPSRKNKVQWAEHQFPAFVGFETTHGSISVLGKLGECWEFPLSLRIRIRIPGFASFFIWDWVFSPKSCIYYLPSKTSYAITNDYLRKIMSVNNANIFRIKRKEVIIRSYTHHKLSRDEIHVLVKEKVESNLGLKVTMKQILIGTLIFYFTLTYRSLSSHIRRFSRKKRSWNQSRWSGN